MKFWVPSRLKSNFHKLPLVQSRYFDAYILRFREGSWAPWHTDPVEGRRHYRVNIILKKAKRGGEFQCDKVLFKAGRLVVFRPDQEKHSVSPIKSGTRWVLSFGFTRPLKP